MRSKSNPYLIVDRAARERRRIRDQFAVRRTCTQCGVDAVVPLSPEERESQPDGTTHVCHPAIGGCDQGYKFS